MGKFKTLYKVIVIAYTKADEVVEYLSDIYSDFEWEFDDETKIIGSKIVNGYYEPQVTYTHNGDGSPAVWEIEEAIYPDDLVDEIRESIGVEVEVYEELDD